MACLHCTLSGLASGQPRSASAAAPQKERCCSPAFSPVKQHLPSKASSATTPCTATPIPVSCLPKTFSTLMTHGRASAAACAPPLSMRLQLISRPFLRRSRLCCPSSRASGPALPPPPSPLSVMCCRDRCRMVVLLALECACALHHSKIAGNSRLRQNFSHRSTSRERG